MIKLRDLATNQEKAPLKRWCNYSLAFSPDGTTVAACGASPSADVWDLTTGKPKPKYSTVNGYRSPNGHRNMVTAVAISPNSNVLATGSWDKTVRLWDLSSGEWMRTLEGHQGFVLCVTFSADGKTLASGSTDKTVRLWDAATGEHREVLEAHSGAVNSAAFSPDGTVLASGSNDSTVKLWYLGANRNPESLATDAAVTSVAFSSDGNALAASSGKTVKLWRTSGTVRSSKLNARASSGASAHTTIEAVPEEQR
jgi:WD40 repeat protein